MTSARSESAQIKRAADAVSAKLWCASGQHEANRDAGHYVRRGLGRQFECNACRARRKARAG